MPEAEFRWLHISDLHTGMSNQDWLWPTLKHSLFTDLRKLHGAIGPWQLVIFSGDLVQQGARAEFAKLDTILKEIWRVFRDLGFTPSLFVVPGNHDLARPKATEPTGLVLKRWWEEREVREEFFSNTKSTYRKTIEQYFSEYTLWCNRVPDEVPLITRSRGLLPGDASGIIETDGHRVGIVGLNSTWLQLDNKNYRSSLHVDTRQLLAVTEGDPASWCSRNTLNLLVTHQGVDWLHPDSESYWNSDIAPPGRFHVHLFGHMHEPTASLVSQGGSMPRASVQAASLCGLEYTGERNLERVHGYSLCQSRRNGFGIQIHAWPRKLRPLISGERKFGPGAGFDLALQLHFAFQM